MSVPFKMITISSRENAQVKAWRRLAQEPHAYRKTGQVWLEGEHLCSVAKQACVPVQALVLSQSRWDAGELEQWLPAALPNGAAGQRLSVVVLDDALFAHVSGLESAAGLAYVMPCGDEVLTAQPGQPTVVLDRLQDAGNVGAILRCAAAFGFKQIVAVQGTAALWSPKVLRAGMGAHFGLRLVEQAQPQDVLALQVPLLITSSHEGAYLHQADLPWPCAWVMGHEGQGVGAALSALAHTPVRIAQPGGQESLNVATAAAICLHASAAAWA
ncbi:RNA methyltransferase [Lampropedia puyangensis]|uniref:RNA methyltransferase n=1 Tax=Lampropedia puyangensis TaxID=1330072 RepID=A0A4V4GSF3_9BURK|nr:RNA methyltransferase [Lampropedia puyangensis]THU05296.1 RNA methyltransferase [Lampropedia puyangensis]